ncbi:putative transcription factor interactor and regulator CCHC(Zn) family [Medicago truncatula]|uniref:Putative transcription factor interactor and regulator CCHC(Zn) family n=1 Tax=Medicago truncatula TaxID=3880 RepID=A0A396GZP9_MEDTR|nr:putative transcription factor interactor and regulator CCHC(Zn) family [Medicago truncatula]
MRIKCYFCDKYGHDESICHVKKKFIKQNNLNLSSERSHLNRSESSQKAGKAKKTCFYCNKSDHKR